MIAAKRDKGKPSSTNKIDRHRWVKGNLILPTEWGETFGLYQSGSGCFENVDESGGQGQKNEDDAGPEKAANLYTETMLEGLQLFQKLVDECKEKNVDSPFHLYPSPLSGPPPNKDGKLVGSPLLSSKEVNYFQSKLKESDDPKLYHITQGELYFYKELNLNNFDEKLSMKWFIAEESVRDVLVKVWWKGIHRCLQDVNVYASTVDWLNTQLNRKPNEDLKASLCEVFLGMGASTTPPVSYTIMRRVTGEPVKLKGNENTLSITDCWNCFKTLCNDILLPLADMGIIYGDLRPGYDCTYNVLLVEDKSDLTKKKMVLIDYESLCKIKDYSCPSEDKRYPKIKRPKNRGKEIAHDFLFQQCVGVVYSWIKGTDSKDFTFEEALKWWHDIIEDELVQTHGILQKRAADLSLDWWVTKLSDDDSKDAEKTKEAFNEALFTKIDKQLDQMVETTREKAPVAKSNEVSFDDSVEGSRKKPRHS